MRSLILLSICAVAALAVACGGGDEPAPPPADGGASSTPAEGANPLADALAKAAESGKNILVEYYDSTCDTCKKMDQEVFELESVADALGGVVYVRVTKGKDAKAFEQRFGSLPTPSFVVLSAKGEPQGKLLSGSLDEGNFLKLVDWAVAGEGTQPSLKIGSS